MTAVTTTSGTSSQPLRHISPAEARVFCLSLENYATRGAAKGKARTPAAAASRRRSKRSRPAAARPAI